MVRNSIANVFTAKAKLVIIKSKCKIKISKEKEGEGVTGSSKQRTKRVHFGVRSSADLIDLTATKEMIGTDFIYFAAFQVRLQHRKVQLPPGSPAFQKVQVHTVQQVQKLEELVSNRPLLQLSTN